jgi:hypothetical protein
MIAEGGDLIAHAFEGVAEVATVDNEATGEGIALRLVTD